MPPIEPVLTAYVLIVSIGLGAGLLWLGGRGVHTVARVGLSLALIVSAAAYLRAGQAPLEFTFGPVGGLRLDLGFNAVAFVAGLGILLPAWTAVIFGSWRADFLVVALVAVTAALVALLTRGIVATSIAAMVMAMAVAVLSDVSGLRAPLLFAGTLLLAGAGVAAAVAGGTDVYGAVPVGTAGPLPALAVAAVACLFALAAPLELRQAALSRETGDGRLPRTVTAVACLAPVGFSLMLRLYPLGGGQAGGLGVQVALGATGIAVAVAALLWAQVQDDPADLWISMLQVNAGLIALATAIGSLLALTAALLGVAAQAILLALLAVFPERTAARVVAFLIVLGAPPSLVFAFHLLLVQATLEAGPGWSLLTVVQGLLWLFSLATAARLVGTLLAGGPGRARSQVGAWLMAGGLVVAGVFTGALAGTLSVGVNSYLLAGQSASSTGLGPAFSGDPSAVVSASGAWPALPFAVGLLAVAVLVVGAGLRFGHSPPARVDMGPGPGWVQPPAAAALAARLRPGWWARFAHRSGIPGPARLEQRMAASGVFFWLAFAGALTFVAMRWR